MATNAGDVVLCVLGDGRHVESVVAVAAAFAGRLGVPLALERADEAPALVVVGADEPGAVARMVARELWPAVLQEARCPVVVVPGDLRTAPASAGGTLLVGVDTGSPAVAAVRAASVLARPGRARLLLVHVERPRTFITRIGRGGAGGGGRLRARRVLRRALREVDPRVPTETELRHGDAAEELLAAADEVDAELLVLGTRGRRRVTATPLGSLTRTVIRQAKRPVLVAPGLTPGREA